VQNCPLRTRKFDRQPLLTAAQIPLRLDNMSWRFLIDKQLPFRHTIPAMKKLVICDRQEKINE
jgi:hypothetical protein